MFLCHVLVRFSTSFDGSPGALLINEGTHTVALTIPTRLLPLCSRSLSGSWTNPRPISFSVAKTHGGYPFPSFLPALFQFLPSTSNFSHKLRHDTHLQNVRRTFPIQMLAQQARLRRGASLRRRQPPNLQEVGCDARREQDACCTMSALL